MCHTNKTDQRDAIKNCNFSLEREKKRFKEADHILINQSVEISFDVRSFDDNVSLV